MSNVIQLKPLSDPSIGDPITPLEPSNNIVKKKPMPVDLWEQEKASEGKSEKKRPPGYTSWALMKQRCENPDNPSFGSYGGKGITYHPAWKAFAQFAKDMGPPPSPIHTLDRIDVNGMYEPGNCRWATKVEQARNRTTTRLIEFEGQSYSLAQLAEDHGISPTTLARRLDAGLAVETAISMPVSRGGDRSNQHTTSRSQWDCWPSKVAAASQVQLEADYRASLDCATLSRPQYFIRRYQPEYERRVENMAVIPSEERDDVDAKKLENLGASLDEAGSLCNKMTQPHHVTAHEQARMRRKTDEDLDF